MAKGGGEGRFGERSGAQSLLLGFNTKLRK